MVTCASHTLMIPLSPQVDGGGSIKESTVLEADSDSVSSPSDPSSLPVEYQKALMTNLWEDVCEGKAHRRDDRDGASDLTVGPLGV
ncbi:hypothetical protein NHX12_008489 [Muraenolepis orangiensis]|uniref:Uncharacterized protein n=1 Tax=Muraenolepis orangiensis TaxID=630683 RepID=A0A9Q0DJT6_9TELE|nr:hypothetical protein NHX12_008489 [Muraenolepis orangiensis]